jgi:hypothetical protein
MVSSSKSSDDGSHLSINYKQSFGYTTTQKVTNHTEKCIHLLNNEREPTNDLRSNSVLHHEGENFIIHIESSKRKLQSSTRHSSLAPTVQQQTEVGNDFVPFKKLKMSPE